MHADLQRLLKHLPVPLQVAIFDATNSTESRRQTLVRCKAHGGACTPSTMFHRRCRQALGTTVFHSTDILLATVQTVLQRQRFHGHFQYLFIESICNDQAVLEQNYRYKMMYSPDYARVDSEQARSFRVLGWL